MNTAKNLDGRLDDLVHEIKEIKKELIREKMARAGQVRERTAIWTTLGKEVSAKWDNVSSIDEITAQREKVTAIRG
jgi:hypothetical protein